MTNPAEAATRENGEDVLEAIDRELSRWACHRSVIEAVKDRARAALSTHQQQGADDATLLQVLADCYAHAGLEKSAAILRNGGELASVQQGIALAAMRRVSRAQQPDTVTEEALREVQGKDFDPQNDNIHYVKGWREACAAFTAALAARGKA